MAAGRFVPSATAGLARKFHNPNITVARSGERLQRMFREILVGWCRSGEKLRFYQYGEKSLGTLDGRIRRGTRHQERKPKPTSTPTPTTTPTPTPTPKTPKDGAPAKAGGRSRKNGRVVLFARECRELWEPRNANRERVGRPPRVPIMTRSGVNDARRFLGSRIGRALLVNTGVGLALLIAYRNGYRGTDLVSLAIGAFLMCNVGVIIGLVVGARTKPSPVPKGVNWIWIPLGLLWLVYILYGLFPTRK